MTSKVPAIDIENTLVSDTPACSPGQDQQAREPVYQMQDVDRSESDNLILEKPIISTEGADSIPGSHPDMSSFELDDPVLNVGKVPPTKIPPAKIPPVNVSIDVQENGLLCEGIDASLNVIPEAPSFTIPADMAAVMLSTSEVLASVPSTTARPSDASLSDEHASSDIEIVALLDLSASPAPAPPSGSVTLTTEAPSEASPKSPIAMDTASVPLEEAHSIYPDTDLASVNLKVASIRLDHLDAPKNCARHVLSLPTGALDVIDRQASPAAEVEPSIMHGMSSPIAESVGTESLMQEEVAAPTESVDGEEDSAQTSSLSAEEDPAHSEEINDKEASAQPELMSAEEDSPQSESTNGKEVSAQTKSVDNLEPPSETELLDDGASPSIDHVHLSGQSEFEKSSVVSAGSESPLSTVSQTEDSLDNGQPISVNDLTEARAASPSPSEPVPIEDVAEEGTTYSSDINIRSVSTLTSITEPEHCAMEDIRTSSADSAAEAEDDSPTPSKGKATAEADQEEPATRPFHDVCLKDDSSSVSSLNESDFSAMGGIQTSSADGVAREPASAVRKRAEEVYSEKLPTPPDNLSSNSAQQLEAPSSEADSLPAGQTNLAGASTGSESPPTAINEPQNFRPSSADSEPVLRHGSPAESSSSVKQEEEFRSPSSRHQVLSKIDRAYEASSLDASKLPADESKISNASDDQSPLDFDEASAEGPTSNEMTLDEQSDLVAEPFVRPVVLPEDEDATEASETGSHSSALSTVPFPQSVTQPEFENLLSSIPNPQVVAEADGESLALLPKLECEMLETPENDAAFSTDGSLSSVEDAESSESSSADEAESAPLRPAQSPTPGIEEADLELGSQARSPSSDEVTLHEEVDNTNAGEEGEPECVEEATPEQVQDIATVLEEASVSLSPKVSAKPIKRTHEADDSGDESAGNGSVDSATHIESPSSPLRKKVKLAESLNGSGDVQPEENETSSPQPSPSSSATNSKRELPEESAMHMHSDPDHLEPSTVEPMGKRRKVDSESNPIPYSMAFPTRRATRDRPPVDYKSLLDGPSISRRVVPAGKKAKFNEQGQRVYCSCREPDLGTFMISCDNCEEWFHGSCVGLTKKTGEQLEAFTCPACQDLAPRSKRATAKGKRGKARR
ncbi:CXXC-type zinc finger protein 1 [Thoreauomyces humboldtii]|nr:CXXC-type zinc finger protein 1 [Thoreauomyces humboldtii]